MPWAEGTSAVRSYGEPGPFLLGFPDAVEGETPEGDKVPCSLFREGAYYHCNSEGDLQTIAVSLQGKRWSWPAKCPYYEDGVRLDLDDGCGGTGAPFQLTPEGARDNQ